MANYEGFTNNIDTLYTESAAFKKKMERVEEIINEEEGVEEKLEYLGFKKMIKTTETIIKMANPESNKLRYIPGNKLVTYTGIDENGNPIQETWGGGVANIKEDSVILSNGPIKYPEGHEYAGEVVRGNFDEDGKFTIDQEGGTEILENEYVSNPDYVKTAFSVDATTNPQKALKLISSYVKEVDDDMVDKGKKGIMIGEHKIKVDKGGYIVANVDETGEKSKFKGVNGITKEYLESTYTDYNEYLKNINN